jgi:hypothetical protein
VIGRRDITIKREQVLGWLVERGKMDAPPPLRTFFEEKLEAEGLTDVTVDMGDEGEMKLVDVVMAEVDDYV